MPRVSLYITLFLILILVIYLAFLDALAKPVFEDLATEQYGAEVTVDSLSLQPFFGKATLYQLQVVDRRDAMRNLVQADRVYVDIDMIKLVENVIDVSEMEIDGLLSFAPRTSPGTILRPLVKEDSGLAGIDLPTFELPDVDQLINRKRDALEADAKALESSFENIEAKWKETIDSAPGEEDIETYKQRLEQLKDIDNPLQALTAVQEAQSIYDEVNRELERLRGLQQDFRGDMQMLQQQVDLATGLPEKYTTELIRSLGLDSEQMGKLGQTILRGDLDGLLQQVLAPLALNTSGQASAQEDAMPIFVRHARVNGSLLPSAAGLSVNGELKDFAWPLENADSVASLLLNGSSLNGGSLTIDANVDHRGTPNDRVAVTGVNIPLKDMPLSGTDELGIQLLQTLVSVTGEMLIKDGKLDGAFTNQFNDAVFETNLREGAGQAAQLISRVLASSNEFMMQIGFGGSLLNPELSFASDMDQIFQSTIEAAISTAVAELTSELKQQLASEIGPRLTTARQNFTALESLQTDLRKNLGELNTLAGQR
jgi:uncharacterized protein (TIGR03545 family)